jgi:hypothetical protein
MITFKVLITGAILLFSIAPAFGRQNPNVPDIKIYLIDGPACNGTRYEVDLPAEKVGQYKKKCQNFQRQWSFPFQSASVNGVCLNNPGLKTIDFCSFAFEESKKSNNTVQVAPIQEVAPAPVSASSPTIECDFTHVTNKEFRDPTDSKFFYGDIMDEFKPVIGLYSFLGQFWEHPFINPIQTETEPNINIAGFYYKDENYVTDTNIGGAIFERAEEVRLSSPFYFHNPFFNAAALPFMEYQLAGKKFYSSKYAYSILKGFLHACASGNTILCLDTALESVNRFITQYCAVPPEVQSAYVKMVEKMGRGTIIPGSLRMWPTLNSSRSFAKALPVLDKAWDQVPSYTPQTVTYYQEKLDSFVKTQPIPQKISKLNQDLYTYWLGTVLDFQNREKAMVDNYIYSGIPSDPIGADPLSALRAIKAEDFDTKISSGIQKFHIDQLRGFKLLPNTGAVKLVTHFEDIRPSPRDAAKSGEILEFLKAYPPVLFAYGDTWEKFRGKASVLFDGNVRVSDFYGFRERTNWQNILAKAMGLQGHMEWNWVLLQSLITGFTPQKVAEAPLNKDEEEAIRNLLVLAKDLLGAQLNYIKEHSSKDALWTWILPDQNVNFYSSLRKMVTNPEVNPDKYGPTIELTRPKKILDFMNSIQFMAFEKTDIGHDLFIKTNSGTYVIH